MLTRINKQREDREAGFTLIELLVVVAIIAILAVIAIPIFNNLRDSAANTAGESDIRNAVTTLEVFYTAEGSFPAEDVDGTPTLTGPSTGDDYVINMAPDIAMEYSSVGSSFTLYGCNTQVTDAEVYAWDSDQGTFVDTTGLTCDPVGTGWTTGLSS